MFASHHNITFINGKRLSEWPHKAHNHPVLPIEMSTDSSYYTAALDIARCWLNKRKQWNFREFKTYMDPHMYPLLQLSHPSSPHCPPGKKKSTRKYVEARMKDLWGLALTDLAVYGLPSQANRAVKVLRVSLIEVAIEQEV